MKKPAVSFIAAVALAVALIPPVSVAAQTTTVALTQALEAHMDRPLSPPEAWAAATAARNHAHDVRRIRDAFTVRLAEATGLSKDAVAALIPPLGRGPQSAMPADLPEALADRLGRPLTKVEATAIADANTERQAALAPHRAVLITTLARLTDLPPERISPLLPKLGL